MIKQEALDHIEKLRQRKKKEFHERTQDILERIITEWKFINLKGRGNDSINEIHFLVDEYEQEVRMLNE